MTIKRKRSDSEISRSTSLLSSPPSNIIALDIFQFPDHQVQIPSLFSSRTRKRHRDNRPSEEEVHHHTLSLLFSAQHTRPTEPQFQSNHPQPPPQQSGGVLSTGFRRIHQQSSLHSFWALPNARETSPSSNASTESLNSPAAKPPMPGFFATNCEDCDAALVTVDNPSMDVDVDMMMAMDNSGVNNYGCTRCAKPVCSRCSISNLGVGRKCLACAGRERKWIGVVGWMDQD